ncbi:MAG: hypothetical protein NVSMB68_12070 [Thermoanaerobaculia bacterium]
MSRISGHGGEIERIETYGRWRYSETMPTLFGVGTLPLLQWLLVPFIEVTSFRFIAARRQFRR